METICEKQEAELVILDLGGRGDGIARHNGRVIFVPFAAPRDRVRVAVETINRDSARARLLEVLQPGLARAAPSCVHFTACGGCALQHITPAIYKDFKRGLLLQAVERAGYNIASVKPLITVGPGTRRRAEFSVSVSKGTISIGFLAARSHQVINLSMCSVLRPAIVHFIPVLREALEELKKPSVIKTANVTETDNGLDVLLTLSARLAASDRAKLESWNPPPLLRLSMRDESGEIIKLSGCQAVTVSLGGLAVELPAGGFLQATAESEQAMANLVLRYTRGDSNVADIYSGIGTYAFPLAQAGHHVWAYEGEARMVHALYNAVRRNGLENRLHAESRDLYRQPLSASDLSMFDAAVINPPRNGAGPQARELAASGVKRIIMVSCNPVTFARDAATLRTGGYQLREAIPVDQFLWSAQLELVAVFEKTG